MIESIEIENFQSHTDTSISFNKGLNIILGPSDAGKSAILRAFLWVLRNRPTGDSIHNWNAKKETSVGVMMPEGSVIKERTRGETSYSLMGSDEKLHTFEKVKTDVPEEIQALLNISDINIQTQHEPYFLLNDSPGEVAKKLNEIVGLDIIDSMFKAVNRIISGAKGDVDITEININSLSGQINDLSYVDKAVEEIEELEELIKTQAFIKKKYDSVSVILRSLSDNNQYEGTLKNWLTVKDEVIDLMNRQDILHGNKVQAKSVSEFIQSIESARQVEDICQGLLEVKDDYLSIVNLLAVYGKNVLDYKEIDDIVDSIDSNDRNQALLHKERDVLIEKRQKIITKNLICPTCGQSINKTTAEKIYL